MKEEGRRPKGITDSFCEYRKVNKCGIRCKVTEAMKRKNARQDGS